MTVYFGFIILGQQKPTGGLQDFIYHLVHLEQKKSIIRDKIPN